MKKWILLLLLVASAVQATQSDVGRSDTLNIRAGQTQINLGKDILDSLTVTGPAWVDTITSSSLAILDTARIDSANINKLSVFSSAKFTGATITGLTITSGGAYPDTLWLGTRPIALVFSGGGTAGKRWRMNLLDLDTLRMRDSTTVLPGAKINFMAGSIFQAAAADLDSITGGTIATGIFNIGTATNWQLGGTAYTGTMANLNTLRDDSMADALHRHSELSASDGSPNPAVQVDATGSVFFNDTANSFSVLGHTVNQGANDDEALSLKSSDVSHGATGTTEDDTYGLFFKYAATTGGLSIRGMTEDQVGLWLVCTYTNDNTTHTAAGRGHVELSAAKKSGTGQGSTGADANLFAVTNAGSTRFIVDAEGDLFADGSAPTIYDGYDDVALLSTFDYHEARVSNQKIMESEWEDYTKYHEKDLIEMGLIGGPRAGVDPSQRGLINYTGMVRLHNGAIRQVGRSVNELDYRTERLAEDMAYLKSRYRPDPTFDDVQAVLLKWMYSLFAGGN